jgi:peptidoglycan/LPS O-acetylase OafA/YrhL
MPVPERAETALSAVQGGPAQAGKVAAYAPPTRAGGLDGVRALAVLAVLAFHEGLPWIPGGFLGVDVFFVLSGYLITDLLAARFGRDGRVGLATFWQRRARRLLPALAAMLVTVTAAVSVLEPDQSSSLRPALLGAVTYTSNWWQAVTRQSYWTRMGPPPPLQHLWSLAVEEQFYLLWPLILALVLIGVRRRALRAAVAWTGAVVSALVMLTLYVPGADPSRVYYGTDTHASGLMIGAALALTWPLAKVTVAAERLWRRFDLAGLVGLAILAFAMGHFSGANPALYPFGLTLAALGAGGLVLAAAAPGWIGAGLSWAPLRWLGVRSYGIYLWHWPVIAITAGVAPRAASSFGARIVDAVAPVLLAAVSWRWLEEPILRNGFRAELTRRLQLLRQAVMPARSTPGEGTTAPGRRGLGLRQVPLAVAAAMACVASLAGYGLVHRPSGPTLQAQIAAGERISAATQARVATQLPLVDPGSWWRRIGEGPSRPATGRAQAHVAGWKVIAIGDSVMLASAPELARALPGIYINAKVSRAMVAGVALAQSLAGRRHLRRVLLVGLGTNGPISLGQIEQLRAAVGRSRWLVLVNTFVPRPWEHEVNVTLAAAARRYPNVLLVNWHDAIEHRTRLLWSDGIHPQPAGGALYARVIRARVLFALRKAPFYPRPHRPPTGIIADMARRIDWRSGGW